MLDDYALATDLVEGGSLVTNLSRRGILGAIICAPAIVRASSLMAVKAEKPWPGHWWSESAEINEASLETMYVEINRFPKRSLTNNSWWMVTNAPQEEFTTKTIRYIVGEFDDGQPLFSTAHPGTDILRDLSK